MKTATIKCDDLDLYLYPPQFQSIKFPSKGKHLNGYLVIHVDKCYYFLNPDPFKNCKDIKAHRPIPTFE